ncbi:C-X-C motif chemokine 6 [Saccopteryx bilineata]|uniref:C-X-C motif chemokine 6 n=1 Tax=Saccopteryx bilineata TaxID=59482 RepID=UPI00338F3251
MSLQSSCAALVACVLRPSGTLCPQLALLLLLLTPPAPLASGVSLSAPSAVQIELRCICTTITARISPQLVRNMVKIPAGPQCPRVEVIANMKNGRQVCMDPEARVVRKMIQLSTVKSRKIKKDHALE